MRPHSSVVEREIPVVGFLKAIRSIRVGVMHFCDEGEELLFLYTAEVIFLDPLAICSYDDQISKL